jgi:uncharacterized protein
MAELGNFNELKVNRFSPHGAYLDSGLGEILLPNKYVPAGTKEGDIIRVFLYTDSEDRNVATTLEPLAKLGDFAALKVKSVTDFGAFLNWGLEKDLFLPNKEQHKPVKEGDTCVVKVCLDNKTGRLMAVNKLGAFLSKDTENLKEGQKVELLVYEITSLGYMVLIDYEYAGMAYKNEAMESLSVGDRREGYIKLVREDGKVDVSLYKQGFEAMEDFQKILYDRLSSEGGFLPLNDNSDPEEIRSILKMSKKSFKKAVGMLMKSGKISIEDNGIRIKK